jgi:hypothetical protein
LVFFESERNGNSGKNWVINLEIAQNKGKRFSQFFCSEKIKGNLNKEKYLNLDEKELDNLCYDDCSDKWD